MDKIDDGDAVNLSTGLFTSFIEFARMSAELVGYRPEVRGMSDKPAGVHRARRRYGEAEGARLHLHDRFRRRHQARARLLFTLGVGSAGTALMSSFESNREMHASERQWLQDAVPCLFLIFSIAIYANLILSGDGRAPVSPMDQGFVYVDLHIYYNGTNWVFQYPHLSWSGGITGSLIIGLYKLLIPTSVETLNWHVKVLSATFFLASVFWLARAYKLDWLNQVAVLAIVASSGLLLLEPSTEVLAGAFLNLFAIAIRWHRHAILQALLLAVFSLIKIELLPVGVVVAAFWAATSRFPARTRLTFLAAFVISLIALIIPAVYLYGERAFLSGRSFGAFAQHYCYLFHHDFSANCLAQAMPDVRTMGEVVRNHTMDYLVFLGTATIKSSSKYLFYFELACLQSLVDDPTRLRVRSKRRSEPRTPHTARSDADFGHHGRFCLRSSQVSHSSVGPLAGGGLPGSQGSPRSGRRDKVGRDRPDDPHYGR